FTLITVAAMGYVVGLIAEHKNKFGWYIIAILSALAIKIAGYYIAEAIIYQNIMIPMASIPGNIVQVTTASIIVLIVIVPLRKATDLIFK
ncbi:MAG: ECF transporter S component, partial [Ruminococcus sp.]|nr:ECF transporter S component [Ruminococcus sp.]